MIVGLPRSAVLHIKHSVDTTWQSSTNMDTHIENNRTAALLQEFAELFKEQHASLEKLAHDTDNAIVGFVIVVSFIIVFGSVIFISLPYTDCTLHKHFAGSDCTCTEVKCVLCSASKSEENGEGAV